MVLHAFGGRRQVDDLKKALCLELAERISITTTDHNDRRLAAGKPSALDFRIGASHFSATCLLMQRQGGTTPTRKDSERSWAWSSERSSSTLYTGRTWAASGDWEDGVPDEATLLNMSSAFLAVFFGPGLELEFRPLWKNKVEDEFKTDLHRCFGLNADLLEKAWASFASILKNQLEMKRNATHAERAASRHAGLRPCANSVGPGKV